MEEHIKIDSAPKKRLVQELLKRLPFEPVHEIIIREYKRDISTEQRGLYWRWLTIRAANLGTTKDDEHLELKRRFLVPIFERDDKTYAEMINAIRDLYLKGNGKERKTAVSLSKEIVKLTSIRDANTKQMTEYMKEIETDSQNIGISLPHPEDEWYAKINR